MKASYQIENIYDEVVHLLRKDHRYRDNDAMLVAKIWSIQLGGMNEIKGVNLFDFLVEYVNDKTFLYSHESITRARRKAQEQFPELRGDKWQKRHSETESVIQTIQKL